MYLIYVTSTQSEPTFYLLSLSWPTSMGRLTFYAIFAGFLAINYPTWMKGVQWLTTWPYDEVLGEKLDEKTPAEMISVYSGKSALILGGGRGIGFGISTTLVKAGIGELVVVGRSSETGNKATQKLKSIDQTQKIDFLPGDIGSVNSTIELIKNIKRLEKKFDFLVVTAGIFPVWDDLMNEDGLERAFAIAVVGRFLIYREMGSFLKQNGQILNVLASGMQFPYFLDRKIASGEQRPNFFIQVLLNFNTAHELMLLGFEQRAGFVGESMRFVSTHPGVIATELHVGQGHASQMLFRLFEWALGISEEECGRRQASILASAKLYKGNVSYVDMFGTGRLRSSSLEAVAKEHLEWLYDAILPRK